MPWPVIGIPLGTPVGLVRGVGAPTSGSAWATGVAVGGLTIGITWATGVAVGVAGGGVGDAGISEGGAIITTVGVFVGGLGGGSVCVSVASGVSIGTLVAV